MGVSKDAPKTYRRIAMNFMDFLWGVTLTLISASCTVYITKELMIGWTQFIKKLVIELNEIETKKSSNM